MFAFLVASLGIATAQTITVTGKVVAEKDGEPVAGAYVLVNGTTIGTITNDLGEFGIKEVPASAKELIVTFLGLATTSAPVQAQPLTIVMREDQNYLDDVVVVAYGTVRREAATGSVCDVVFHLRVKILRPMLVIHQQGDRTDEAFAVVEDVAPCISVLIELQAVMALHPSSQALVIAGGKVHTVPSCRVSDAFTA